MASLKIKYLEHVNRDCQSNRDLKSKYSNEGKQSKDLLRCLFPGKQKKNLSKYKAHQDKDGKGGVKILKNIILKVQKIAFFGAVHILYVPH